MSKTWYLFTLGFISILTVSSCKRSETASTPKDLQQKGLESQEAEKKQKQRETVNALMPQENLSSLALQKKMTLGGMYTAREEFTTYPFSLGPTGIFATRAGKIKASPLYDPKAKGKTSYVVTSIDKASPADGKISAGDIIIGANGKLFTANTSDFKQSQSRFPNPQMGMAIEQAEANQGKLTLMVKSNKDQSPKIVELQLQPLGALDSAGGSSVKSEYLATLQAKILHAHQNKDGGWGTSLVTNGKKLKSKLIPSCMCALALMSTGDEQYTPAIKKAYNYIVATKIRSFHTWQYGYKSLFLTEYYLRYRDIRSKPAVQEMVNRLSEGYFYYNGIYGYGHGLSSGNYRYGGINVCTAHACLTFAMGKILDCKIPNNMDVIMAKSLERLAPDGAMAYTWNATRRGKAPNKHNEHQCRTGIGAIAYYHLGGRPEQYQKFMTFLQENSEYADCGHATGGTLSWGSSALAFTMGDDARFHSYMSSKTWQFAFNRRWDYGYYLQPSPHGQHRGSDHAIGGDYILATNTILFNRHKRNLIVTGMKDVPKVQPSYLTELIASTEYYRRKSKITEVLEAINIMQESAPSEVYQHLERLKKIPIEAADYNQQIARVYQDLPEVGRAVANSTMSPDQRNQALSALLGLNFTHSLGLRGGKTLVYKSKIYPPNQGKIQLITIADSPEGVNKKHPRKTAKPFGSKKAVHSTVLRTPFTPDQDVKFTTKIIWNGIQIDYFLSYKKEQRAFLTASEGIRGKYSPSPWEVIRGPFYGELKALKLNGAFQIKYPDGNIYETSVMKNGMIHTNGKSMQLDKYMKKTKGQAPIGQKIQFTYFLRGGRVDRPMCDSIYLTK